ncbi:hypothetical protein D3C80_1379700 [compost metagenome]
MKHPRLTQVGLAQQRQGIGPGRPRMDDDRLAGDFRRLQVKTEGVLLDLGRLGLVVVVQPGFTDGYHVRVFKLLEQPFQRRSAVRGQVQRMNPHRTVDIAVALAEVLDRLGVVGTDADTQKVTDTSRPGRLEGGIQGVLVRGKVETIEVTMGIYKHGFTTTLKNE